MRLRWRGGRGRVGELMSRMAAVVKPYAGYRISTTTPRRIARRVFTDQKDIACAKRETPRGVRRGHMTGELCIQSGNRLRRELSSSK